MNFIPIGLIVKKWVLCDWAKEVMIIWAEMALIGLSRGSGPAKDAFALKTHNCLALRDGKSPGFDENGLFGGGYLDLGKEGKKQCFVRY